MQRNSGRKTTREPGNGQVREQRQNGENPGYHRNRHATGADKTGSSQVPGAEVRNRNKEVRVEYSRLNDNTDTIDLPTPPPTPNKSRTCTNGQFPLFDSLLQEGRQNNKTGSNTLHVPATAPVHVNTTNTDTKPLLTIHSPRKHGESGGKSNVVLNLEFDETLDDMEIEKKKAMITKVVEDVMRKDRNSPMMDDSNKLLTLQDPPKSKLKRQLSVGTADAFEATRIRKRAYTRSTVNDENNKQSWTPYVDSDEVDGAPPFHAYKEDMPNSSRTRYPYQRTSTERQSYTSSYTTVNEEDNLNSPALFDMRDIGLTSPFVSKTPRKPGRQDETVFVFPETSTSKVSPAKPTVSSNPYASMYTNTDSLYNMDEPLNLATRSSKSEIHSFKHNSSESRASTTVSSTTSYRNYPVDPHVRETRYTSNSGYETDHVTNKGFVWPASAAVTQATAFSPRVTSAETKRFPLSTSPKKTTSASSSCLSDDGARLLLLEREYARARQVYGHHATESDSREITSRSHEVTGRKNTLRSISDVDRSPNENDIRGMSDDVRTRYERSVSDPRCSPRQLWSKMNQQSSGKTRGRASETATSSPDTRDGHDRHIYRLQADPDSPQDDVRRRLFTREDYEHGPGHDKTVSQSNNSSTETMDLPEEVATFFRSRNIRAEDIDNLLRRSSTSTSSGYEDRKYDTFETELRSRNYNMRDEVFLSPSRRDMATGSQDSGRRMRNKGDIDVRLQCESVAETTSTTAEKTARVKEILTDLDHDDQNCKCARIEEEIFQMANDAFRKIHRADSTPASLGQFHTELDETDKHIYKSLRLLAGIKCLCKYGRSLEDVFPGSVVFRVNCPNVEALEELWEAYNRGDIVRELSDVYVTEKLKEKFGVADITLQVIVSWEEYRICKAELEEAAITPKPTTPDDTAAIVHGRSRSEPINSPSRHVPQFGIPKTLMSPFRERFISDSTIEVSPRRVFQEMSRSACASAQSAPGPTLFVMDWEYGYDAATTHSHTVSVDTSEPTDPPRLNGGKDIIQSSSPSRKSYLENVFVIEGHSKSGRLTPKRKPAGVKAVQEHENIHPGETILT